MVFVQKSIKSEIPSDAIVLSRVEAINYQWQNINSLSMKDVWPLHYSKGIFGGVVACQALYIIMNIRRKLKLGNYGLLTSYLPCVALPALLSSSAQYQYVTNSIVLQNECPVCIYTRSLSIQLIGGILYPILGGGASGFFYAGTYGSADVPVASLKSAGALAKKLIFLVKPQIPGFYVMFALNVVLSFFLIDVQQKAVVKVNAEIERKELEKAKELYLIQKRKRKYSV